MSPFPNFYASFPCLRASTWTCPTLCRNRPKPNWPRRQKWQRQRETSAFPGDQKSSEEEKISISIRLKILKGYNFTLGLKYIWYLVSRIRKKDEEQRTKMTIDWISSQKKVIWQLLFHWLSNLNLVITLTWFWGFC